MPPEAVQRNAWRAPSAVVAVPATSPLAFTACPALNVPPGKGPRFRMVGAAATVPIACDVSARDDDAADTTSTPVRPTTTPTTRTREARTIGPPPWATRL